MAVWPFGRRAEQPVFSADYVPQAIRDWSGLSEVDRARVIDTAGLISRRLRWEPARGMTLTSEIVSTISARAALVVHGRDPSELRVRTVVVHATTVVLDDEEAGPVDGTVTSGRRWLNGQADDEGLILLAWDTVREGGWDGRWGYDVVIHEFAHSLDVSDGVFDGTPLLSSDSQRKRWVDVCTDRYYALRSGDGHRELRPYGATSTAEFFAVAVETLFDRPHRLRAADPELSDLLVEVLGVDPGAWSDPPETPR